jgi:hypothetical protein
MRHALLLGTLVLLVGCSGRSALDASPPERPSSAKAFDGWHVKVSVRPSIVPPLVLSVRAPRAGPHTRARAWQHELVIDNTGRRPLRFADTRSSAFISPPGTRRLIASDEGCGYVPQTTVWPLEVGACLTYLDAFVIKPRARVSRTIALIKGLHGMKPLTPGTYTFERVIRFRVGQEIPDEGEGRSVVVRLDYRLIQR